MESIPGLLRRLQIRALLSTGIGWVWQFTLQSAQRYDQFSAIFTAKKYIFKILQSPLIPELASMANDMELIVGALRDAHLDKVSSASG